ncbi:hypothetical protein MAP00_005233 [Monascus purpureus]|nr:hypothetical protein MAP00_005233 [Monascus purpureus]
MKEEPSSISTPSSTEMAIKLSIATSTTTATTSLKNMDMEVNSMEVEFTPASSTASAFALVEVAGLVGSGDFGVFEVLDLSALPDVKLEAVTVVILV